MEISESLGKLNPLELTKVAFTGETGTTTPDIARTYNRLGRLTQIVHGSQTMTRNYNDVGQLLAEAYTAGPLSGMSVTNGYSSTTLQRASMTALNGSTVLSSMGYSFTPSGGGSAQARLQSVTGGPGNNIAFGYANNASLLESVNYVTNSGTWIGRTMQYDFLNRLKQISTGYGDQHNYEFDALNRRTKDTLGDGSRWDYAYDQLGQLTSAVKTDVGGATSLNNRFSYTADGVGNVLSAKSPTLGGGETFSYSYNKQNQLTVVPHSGTTPVIGMVNSNALLAVMGAVNYPTTQERQGEDFRLQLSTGTTNVDRYVVLTNLAILDNGTNADILTLNVLNRFLPKDASESVSYDADGNVTNDGRWSYTWDALNRLTVMESKSTAPTNSKHKLVFTYDAGGRRIQKEELVWNPATTNYQASTTNKFVYNGWDLVAELNGANVALRSYGWLGKSGGLLWVKDHSSGEFHVPSFDGNRNVTKLIKYSDRSTSAEYEYTPFGTLLRATGSMALANPIRYSSEYHDDTTDLVYYGYRYYAPHLHRWLSKDPIGYAGGLNLYGFVGNDPVNQIDELGLATDAQYRMLIEAALELWRRDGNLTQLGRAGELILEEMLERSGYIIVKGPANNKGQHGPDVVAYDPKNKKVLICDNKIQTKQPNVSRAPAVQGQKAIDDALEKLASANHIDEATKAAIESAIRTGSIERLVANASPAEVRNLVKGLTERLSKKGIGFLDVPEEHLQAQNGRRLARGLVFAGVVLTAVITEQRAEAANAEDEYFQEKMKQLTCNNAAWAPYAHDSLQREMALVAGEEIGGWAGGALGTAAGGAVGGPFGGIGGGMAGSYVGDWLGGGIAGGFYDATHGVTDGQLDSLLMEPPVWEFEIHYPPRR